MSICNRCSYGVMETDDTGELRYTKAAREIIDQHPKDPYAHLPCQGCQLNAKWSGSNFNQGRNIVHLEALHNDGQDFDNIDPAFENNHLETYNIMDEIHHREEKPEEKLYPLSVLIDAQRILRSLNSITRDILEFRMENPNVSLSILAEKHGISAQAVQARLVRALNKNPLLAQVISTKAVASDINQYDKHKENHKKAEQKLWSGQINVIQKYDLSKKQYTRIISLAKHDSTSPSKLDQQLKKIAKKKETITDLNLAMI